MPQQSDLTSTGAVSPNRDRRKRVNYSRYTVPIESSQASTQVVQQEIKLAVERRNKVVIAAVVIILACLCFVSTLLAFIAIASKTEKEALDREVKHAARMVQFRIDQAVDITTNLASNVETDQQLAKLHYDSQVAMYTHIVDNLNTIAVDYWGQPTNVPVTDDLRYRLLVSPPTGRIREDEVLLTFDDGPWTQTTTDVLDILKANNAKATFFVTGSNVNTNPSQLRRIVLEGHEVGVHTYTHAAMTTLSRVQQDQEIQLTLDAIHNALGVNPVTNLSDYNVRYWRPPYGDTNDTLRQYVLDTYGLAEALWSIDTNDWDASNDANYIAAVIQNARGHNILMHDAVINSVETVKALNTTLPTLVAQNTTFHTLSQLDALRKQEATAGGFSLPYYKKYSVRSDTMKRAYVPGMTYALSCGYIPTSEAAQWSATTGAWIWPASTSPTYKYMPINEAVAIVSPRSLSSLASTVDDTEVLNVSSVLRGHDVASDGDISRVFDESSSKVVYAQGVALPFAQTPWPTSEQTEMRGALVAPVVINDNVEGTVVTGLDMLLLLQSVGNTTDLQVSATNELCDEGGLRMSFDKCHTSTLQLPGIELQVTWRRHITVSPVRTVLPAVLLTTFFVASLLSLSALSLRQQKQQQRYYVSSNQHIKLVVPKDRDSSEARTDSQVAVSPRKQIIKSDVSAIDAV